MDNYSAFRFENYLTSIKKWLRKSEKPLQQLLKRYKEIKNIRNLLLKQNYINHKQYACKYIHKNGSLPDDYYVQTQYLKFSNNEFTINCKQYNDNCCLLKTGLYILVMNIVETYNQDLFLIGKQLKCVQDVYEVPCKSSNFNINVVTISNDNICSWPITDVLCKVWKIPYGNNKNTFAIFPINHTI